MRIGIFTPYLDGLTGGEKYILTLASCLSSSHTVSVFWDDTDILNRAKIKFGLNLERVSLVKNIFNRSISLTTRLLETRKYDLLVILSDGSIPFVLSKRLFIHFQFPVEWVSISGKTKIKKMRVHKIICNSLFTKRFIDKKFNINSIVLYPPVDIKAKKAQKKNIILSVGRFGRTIEGSNFKKQDIIINAFKNMVDEGIKGWELVLVISLRKEDNDRFKTLEMLAGNYPIRFIINPKNEKLWEIYSESKIYWHATGFGEDLEKHPEYAEHFGISTVEAMGAGAVPVVINAGGQKEIINNKENGYLWNSINELTEYTKDVMGNESLWKKLSQNAIDAAKKFNQERFCKEINQLVLE